MAKGIIEYDADGNPKCEICGLFFKRVITHVRQKHEMYEREYKETYGFDLNKGICSQKSAARSRGKVLENYDLCVANNLVAKGRKTRFKKGSKGRKKEQVSEQTRLMLKERLKQPKMVAIMKKLGKALGKSGAGNKARWSK